MTGAKSPSFDDLKPLPRPSAPSIDGLSTSMAKAKIEAYIADWEFVLEENQKRFEIALPRMKWCAWWHGFLQPFRPNLEHHYSWCPAPFWYDKWNMERL